MQDHPTSMSREPVPADHVEKHRHASMEIVGSDISLLSVALVGNPNVGKSLFFNYLSGLYVDVSNYPGTTIELIKGRYKSFQVFDTPGVYGISSFTDEEAVTRDVVLQADIVLNVVDASHLERDLFLTQQLIDMGKKVVVVLNFMDEVKKLGLEIDTQLLSSSLGVPVFRTTATTRAGFDQIDAALQQARRGSQDPALHHRLHALLSETGSEAEALLILEGDEGVSLRHGVPPGHERESLYIDRRNRVNIIINSVLVEKSVRTRFATQLGRWAVNPWSGIPLIALALYLIYLFVGKLVAQDVVNFTETTLGHQFWEPWIRRIITHYVSPDSWLGVLL